MSFDTWTLEDAYIQLIDGDRGKNYPKQSNLDVKGYCLFLSAKNVTTSGFKFSEKVFISEELHKKLRAGTLNRGDLVLTTRGTIGNVAFYDNTVDHPVVRINSGMIIVRADRSVWNQRFLYYVFTSDLIKRQILRLTSGSAVPQLPARDLKKLALPKVPLLVQNKIELIISSLIDKIQLNHQINQTLEQMAQAIFKSWFVDFEPVKAKMEAKKRWQALQAGNEPASPVCYAEPEPLPDLETYMNLAAMQAISGKTPEQLTRMEREQPEQYARLRATAELFPSAMQPSELGEIPEGWDVALISDFGKVVCGKTPSKKRPEYYGHDIPFIKIPDMHGNVFATKTNECLSVEGGASQPKKAIPEGSVCVSCIATVGQVIITSEVSHTNQQINSIIPNKKNYSPYLYFRMKSLYKLLNDLASGGSATLNLNTGNFSKIRILRPADFILDVYHQYTRPLLNKIRENMYQNQVLGELRDTLLPKLLSGEITVSPMGEGMFSSQRSQ